MNIPIDKGTKRILACIAVILICAIIFTSCSKYTDGAEIDIEKPIVIEETKVTPIPVPPELPEPDTMPATVRYDISMKYGTLKRGQTVNVKGTHKDFYIIEDKDQNLLYVKKTFIRTANDDRISEHTEYAASNACIYATAMLEGAPITILSVNTPVTVKDRLNGISYVEYREAKDLPTVLGYMDSAELNAEEIKIPAATYGDWGGYGTDDWSGSTAGESYGSPDGGSSFSSGGGYGDDILLSAQRSRTQVTLLINRTGTDKGKVEFLSSGKPKKNEGIVFTDELDMYAGFASEGETVSLVEKTDDAFWTVLYNHLICTVPAYSVLPEGEEEPFAEFDAYVARGNGTLYSDIKLSEDADIIPQNSRVHVKAKFGEIYLLEISETTVSQHGQTGYMRAEEISMDPIYSPYTGYDSGSGGSWEGGNSGDGGGGAATGSEWSDFVM